MRDTGGYPVSITESGSYRLTGDLFVSGTNTSVVVITADDVSLDLNGFTVKCLFFGTPCAGNGTGVGIDASSQSNVTIRNGTVRDMAAAAIDLGEGGRVDRVRAVANGDGNRVLEGEVSSCHSEGNLAAGITAIDSTVRNSESRENTVGIQCAFSSTRSCKLIGNVITRNGAPLSGASTSLGQNLRCDSGGLCTLF